MTTSPRATILVVDDVPENITVMAGILGPKYRVLFATCGVDALALARQQRVDLILLDVMMPEMDGYAVCRQLKADLATRTIPVIFVSALGEVRDEAQALELGGIDFLHKPCHASIVMLRVDMHIEMHNQNIALERRVRERTLELEETRREIVRRLGRAAEYRDNETGMHVVRMSKASYLLGVAAGLAEHHAQLLQQAASMHDIGKIGIPDDILLKPGRLSGEAWEQMKRHTVIGAEIIGEHDSELLRMARIVALTHHEKWDGSGYPNGLSGDAIPLEGRIVHIADVYDALTSTRPYKKAWSSEEAVAYMQEQSGRSFDPQLLQLFLASLPQVEALRQAYSG